MTDAAQPATVSLATRHVMQANKSENTGPELLVRAALRQRGLAGYRIHWKRAAGKPDVAYPGRRVAIFVNGCFWHRCPRCHPSTPHTNAGFWQEKFARNQRRDRRNEQILVEQGWTVLVVWECRLRKRRAARTMSEVSCEVRLRPSARQRGQAGTGAPRGATRAPRVIVMGAGTSCYERALRLIRRRAARVRAGGVARGRRG